MLSPKSIFNIKHVLLKSPNEFMDFGYLDSLVSIINKSQSEHRRWTADGFNSQGVSSLLTFRIMRKTYVASVQCS